MKPPEPVVDGIHLHARRASPAFLRGDESFDDNQRRGLPEGGSELLAKEPLRRHHTIGIAQSLKHEIAKAGAHRYADHQRACEHRNGDGDAADDGKIGTPVVA